MRRRDVICSLSRPAVALDGLRRSAWRPTTLVFSLALAGLGCKGAIGTGEPDQSGGTGDTGGPVGSGSTTGSGSNTGSGSTTGVGSGNGSGSASGSGNGPGTTGSGSGAGSGIGSTSGTGATGNTTGSSGGTTGTDGGAGSGGGEPTNPLTLTPASPTTAGLQPVQRLTSREYLNTIRDLLADTTLTVDDVPGEQDSTDNNAFPFRQPTAIETVDADNLEGAAEQLATNLVSKIATVLPASCTAPATTAEAGCATQFINTFGPKIYRRPLTAKEVTDLTTLYQTGRTTLALTFTGAIDFLVEAMLQSPGFIYHWEKDPGTTIKSGSIVQLGNYQMANRLSYFLWGSMPDAALFAAAAAGQLSTAAGVQTQVTRMLADPKAQDTMADFFDDLLDVNTLPTRPKDATVYPMYNATLSAAMETEFRTFGVNIVSGSGLFSDLFSSTSSSVTQPLATIYGVTGVTGTAAKAVTLNAAQRGGILTLAGFLTITGETNGSDPVRRGHDVYTRLLCGVLPNPPATVPPVGAPTAGISTRQRFVTHDQNACTAGCHTVMDPIGFGFENYDGIGQYRTIDPDAKTAIDASGTIPLDGETKTFTNALQLSTLLAASPEAQTCFSIEWMRYALNRWEDAGGADNYSIQTALNAFQSGGLNIRSLITAVATSQTFRYRSPDTGEVLQ